MRTAHLLWQRENVWSRQAWLQAIQVLISSARPCRALRTKAASARNGRAMETMSASDAGRESPGHHQSYPTVDALGKIGCRARKVPGMVFEAHMHGPHQHSVFQGQKSEVQRRPQVGEFMHRRTRG